LFISQKYYLSGDVRGRRAKIGRDVEKAKWGPSIEHINR